MTYTRKSIKQGHEPRQLTKSKPILPIAVKIWAFSEPTKWILVQVFHAEQENCDETVLKIKFKKKTQSCEIEESEREHRKRMCSVAFNSLQPHGLCNPPGSSALGFPKQEYWSELPFPTLGDLPDWGMKPVSLMSPALAGRFLQADSLLLASHGKSQKRTNLNKFQQQKVKLFYIWMLLYVGTDKMSHLNAPRWDVE